MRQGRHVEGGDFGLVVGMAKDEGGPGVGKLEKRGGFLGSHGTSLQVEACEGSGRKLGKVVGVGEAEIALGGNMEPDGIEDGRGKMGAERCCREFFMAGIESAIGCVLAEVVEEVTEIVQQSGGNEGGRPTFPLDKSGGLKGVLKNGNGLAEVGRTAVGSEEIEDLIEGGDGLHEARLPGIESLSRT